VKDNTEAFQRALNDSAGLPVDTLYVDTRHERGCVLRYGAVPDGGSPYIDHPETCPCHRMPRDPTIVEFHPGVYRIGKPWWRRLLDRLGLQQSPRQSEEK
jgi:hypothetical protein